MPAIRAVALALLLSLASRPSAVAYGILTHEAVIDAVWEPSILPALRSRFPSAHPDTLKRCRAYAYGGALAPDMGYFPRESRLFSDLLHYARTGDFVQALADGASSPQEYAFSLGARAHYAADRWGHPLGVNRAIAIDFPELGAEHGPEVVFADDPVAHVRAEFGFDVLQTARGSYAAENYTNFIDFAIADSLLKRAFRATYALEVDELFGDYDRSIRNFRWAVSEVFPRLTRQAWKSKREEIRERSPTATARAFRYRMRRGSFQKLYGRDYDRPGLGARLTAGLLRFLPKVGPLKALKPVIPSPAAEAVFIRSFDTVVARYSGLSASSTLMDVNYDTGDPTMRGRYEPADEAYVEWLLKLRGSRWRGVGPSLRAHLLDFFGSSPATAGAGDDREELSAALRELRQRETVD